MILLTKEDRENLILEYEELLNEILQRRQKIWLIHSILLASTFIMSFRSDPELLPFPYIVSLVLVFISWVIEHTNRHVDDSCWKRRHKIENMFGMKGPQQRFKQLKETKKYKIRSRLWDLLFAFLMVIYAFLLLSYLGLFPLTKP